MPLLVHSRRRSGRFDNGGRFGGSGASVSFPHDSPTLFSDTLDSDDFSSYADTAAWAAQVPTQYTLDSYDGGGSAVIDPTVTFNGHQTLKVSHSVNNAGFYGYKDLDAPVGKIAHRFMMRLSPTFVPLGATGEVLKFGEAVDSYSSFSFEAGWQYGFGNRSWQSYADANARPEPLSELLGQWKSVVIYADAVTAATSRYDLWIDGEYFSTWEGDSGSPVDEIASIGVQFFFRKFDGVADPTNNYVHIGLYEWVNRDVYPEPYSGLGDVLSLGEPEPSADRVFPAEVLVAPSGTHQFSLLIADVETPADSWDCTGGAIDSSGLFTAGAVDGEYSVTATLGSDEYTAVVEVATYDPTADVDLWSWADPDAMGQADGSSLATIDDTSGNGNGFAQADAGKQAVVRSGVLNGFDVAEGDGVDDLMDVVNAVPYGERTTFVLTRILPGDDSGHPFVLNGGWERLFRFTGENHWLWYHDTPPGVYIPLGTGSAADNKWALCTFRLNSETSEEISINEGAFVEAEPSINIWSGPSNQTDRLFAHSLGDCCKSQTAIYATILRAMSDAEVRKTRRWINAKYRAY